MMYTLKLWEDLGFTLDLTSALEQGFSRLQDTSTITDYH